MANHPNRNTDKPYACLWVSPRGFANDGYYIACPTAYATGLVDEHADDPDAVVTILGRYANLDKAKGRAMRDYSAGTGSDRRVAAYAVDDDGLEWRYDYAATGGEALSWRRCAAVGL